ncbi:hypothetical protein IPM62_00170 [Candidatus Woesebacteria bacterium]|nr:MAG: hypothetical protein IPM62_00170 [Candidatus Woesebacteria bacterium]
MRTSNKKLNLSLQKQVYSLFNQLIVDIKGNDEAELIMRDFFKDSEYEMFAKRLAIAYWLKKGRSYANIKKNLKVSSATIASIQQTMDKKGIKHALKYVEADEWASKWSEKIKKITRR